jgi:hypothetical protein
LPNAHWLEWEKAQRKTIVNSAEENRAKFCKLLDGKLLFSAAYRIYMVRLKELNAVLKVKAQAGQNGAVNKTPLETTAQNDDFQEVKRCKRHISNDTSQTAEKSTISAPKSAPASCLPKQ